MSRDRIIVLAALGVLAAVVAAAWWFEGSTADTSPGPSTAGSASPATSATSTTAPSYRVKVTRGGRVLATFDLAQLKAMGMETVTLQGQQQVGPPLLTVLERAGVSNFTTVTIVGQGVRDSGRIELPASSVSTTTVLAVAKRGTVKVAGPKIPYAARVRDVLEIDVK